MFSYGQFHKVLSLVSGPLSAGGCRGVWSAQPAEYPVQFQNFRQDGFLVAGADHVIGAGDPLGFVDLGGHARADRFRGDAVAQAGTADPLGSGAVTVTTLSICR